MKRLQYNHSLNGGAVRIGDNPVIPLNISGVYFRYNQRNVFIHSPGAAVVDNRYTVLCRNRRVLFASRAAGGKESDIDILIKRVFVQLFHNIVFSFKGDGFSGRLGRRHHVYIFKREVPFF